MNSIPTFAAEDLAATSVQVELAERAPARPGVTSARVMDQPALDRPAGWRRAFCQPETVTALVLTAVAVGLHLIFLTHAGGLWRDEVNTVNLARLASVGEMSQDSFPVLTPLLVRGWTVLGLGGSDLALRTLGVVVGLGLLAALWASAWVSAKLPPRLGLALFGLNSTVIIYGDSLRAYGMGSLLIVLAFATTWLFLRQPTLWRALLAAILAVLSVQALYQNAVLVAALCFGAWAVAWRRRSGRVAIQVALVASVAAVSLVPYMKVLASGRDGAAVLRGMFQWQKAYNVVCQVTGFPIAGYAWLWMLASLALVAGALVALWRGSGRPSAVTGPAPNPDLSVFTAVTLLAGVAGFAAFHWFVSFPAKAWYLLPVLALVAACIDAGLPPLPRLPRVALLGVVLATAGLAVPYAYAPLTSRLTNVDLVAKRLTATAGAGDFIVVAPWFCGLTFHRYYTGPAAWSTLPPLEDHSLHRYDLLRAQLQNTEAISPVLKQISATLQAGHRVWVVGHMLIFRPGTPAPDNLPPAPLPGSGWSDAPYQRNWLAQVACFLVDHSSQVERVCQSTASEVNVHEDLELVQASGWKPAGNASQ